MPNIDSTRYDPGVTVPEGGETVYESGATMLDAALSDATTQAKSAAMENIAIQKGITLLGTYRVESDAIEGGMGSVWRVHHTGWNVDLAMKRPQPKCFSTEKSKADFIHECEAWINLGLHPNIVSCYYVREIGGTPTIFSEWMDGGSLENAIEKETLYEGTPAEQQARILDIAVQFARGLHYAHEAGLIHQDVKPDNLLLTKEGDAKVADFGLAKARAALASQQSDSISSDGCDSGRTILSPSGGYTPAYCSMEQMDGGELTRRTDIYSWAVSVMEMYLGARPWANGVVAGLGCRGYFEQSRVPMPEPLRKLLAWCLESEQENRPHDFTGVEAELLKIYGEEVGAEYPRSAPKAAADTADSLNNRALSMLDLGKPEEAERCWERAIALNLNHTESVYNNALHKWRTGQIDVEQCFLMVKALQENADSWTGDYFMAMLHYEHGEDDKAVRLFESAATKEKGSSYSREKLQMAKTRNFKWTSNQFPVHVLGTCPALSGDGSVALVKQEKLIYYYNFKEKRKKSDVLFRDQGFGKIVVRNDGKYALTHKLPSKKTPLDRSMQLWDIGTGKNIQSFIPKSEYTGKMCFSKNENFVYLLSLCEVEYFDRTTGETTFYFHGSHVEPFLLSPEEHYILYRLPDSPLCIYDINKEKIIFNIDIESTREEKRPCCACFSPDEKRILIATNQFNIYYIDIESEKILNVFSGHSKSVAKVHILKDMHTAISQCMDYIMIWHLDTGACIKKISANPLPAFQISPNETYLEYREKRGDDRFLMNLKTGQTYFQKMRDGTFSEDESTKVYTNSHIKEHVTTYQIMPPLTLSADWALSRIKDALQVLSVEDSMNQAVEAIEKALERQDIQQAIRGIEAARAIGDFTSTFIFYRLKAELQKYCQTVSLTAWRKKLSYENIPDTILGVTALPQVGRLLAYETHAIYAWDLQTNQLILNTKCNDFNLSRCVFSPDGRYILDYIYKNSATLIDIETLAIRARYVGYATSISSVCFSASGKYLLACGSDRIDRKEQYFIECWNVDSGVRLQTIRVEATCNPQFSQDEKHAEALVTIDKATHFFRWNLLTGELVFDHPFATIATLARPILILQHDADPEGVYWIKQAMDEDAPNDMETKGNAKLINIKSGACVIDFKISIGISAAYFSADARSVITRCADQTIRVWSVKTGRCTNIFAGRIGEAWGYVFSKDGTIVIAQYSQNWFEFYYLDWELMFPGWLDWDDEAQAYLDYFLRANPDYTNKNFEKLLLYFQDHGLGYIKPDSLRQRHEISEHHRIRSEQISNMTGLITQKINDAKEACIQWKINEAMEIADEVDEIIFRSDIDLLHRYAKDVAGIRDNLKKYCVKTEIKTYTHVVGFSQYCEEHNLTAAEIMPNGESILCRFQDENGNDTNQFAIWNIFNSQIAYTFKIEDEIAKVLCITPGGGGILFTLSGNRLGLFSITSGENICRCSGHDDEIVSADISKNEKYMVSLAKDHCIKLWDALTGECIQSHNCVAGNDGKAAFSYNSKWYYYNHEEKIWCARSIESGAIERVYAVERVPYRRASIHQPPPTCISNFYTVSSDGNYALATYEWYKEAEIWYLKDNTAECIQGLKGVQYGKFSSDNQHLFVMTAKKFTAVYSIKEKRVVNRFNMTFRAISNDATYALDQYARLYILHWKYRFPGWADWDEGALPYLEIFRLLHPSCTEEEFGALMIDLQNRGYGWLRPEGVRAKLKELTRTGRN